MRDAALSRRIADVHAAGVPLPRNALTLRPRRRAARGGPFTRTRRDGRGGERTRRNILILIAEPAVAAQRLLALRQRREAAIGAALLVLGAPRIERGLLSRRRCRERNRRRRRRDGKKHDPHLESPECPAPTERNPAASPYFMTGTRGCHATKAGAG